MASIHHDQKIIYAKVVFYGPSASGKTASLSYVYEKTRSPEAKTLVFNESQSSPIAYYDYLPLALGEIRGYKTMFRLFTVPGAQGYAGARRELLNGVDGVVFTADARPARQAENLCYLGELRAHLAQLGFALEKIPFVIQCTFTDAPGALPASQVAAPLLATFPDPSSVIVVASVPLQGVGVFEALKTIAKLVLMELRKG
jgi:mutual gliding-motility protein MglA